MNEYKVMDDFALCQKLKMFWHFLIFANTGPYGAGNVKKLLLQFDPISAKLYDNWGSHKGT